MADSQGTSFIPQRTAKKKQKFGSGIRKIYFISYISYVLFFCTLIVTAGVFVYQLSLDSQLNNAQEALAQERDSFNQNDIERIRELDFRINTAYDLLNNHVSLYSIFRAFEDTTVASVRFLSFSYARVISTIPTVSIQAYADDFDGVLFQREVLKANPVLAGVQVSEVLLEGGVSENGVDPASIVSFNMAASLDQAAVQYTAPTDVFSRNVVETEEVASSTDNTGTSSASTAVNETDVSSDAQQEASASSTEAAVNEESM